MHSLYSLAWRSLSGHKLRSVLVALAIALSVAMVLAASIVGQAARQSATKLSGKGLPSDLEVVSRDRVPFSQDTVDVVRLSPGVERVVPFLRVQARGVEPEIASLTLLGVEPESYAVVYRPKLASGTFLDRPDTVVLPMAVALQNELSVGDEIVLSKGERRVRLVVSGRLVLERDLSDLDRLSTALVPLAAAQYLADQAGRVDRLAVTLSPDRNMERTRAAILERLGDGLVVLQTAGRGDTLATLMVQIGLAMVGGIMLVAAAFVITNAFAMSVTARTREIGSLRALGMTRRQVGYTVLVEACFLGLIGVLVGLPAGLGLAWSVMRVRDALENGFVVPWWGIAVSVTMSLAVTLAGALQPSLRATRVSPLAALRVANRRQDEGWYVRHGGRIGGALLLVVLPGAVGGALILKPDFFLSFVFLGAGMLGAVMGVVLVMPALVEPIARLVGPGLYHWLGTGGRLAVDNLSRNKLRAVLTASALTVGLTTIVATTALLTVSFEGGLNAFFGLFHEDGFIIPDIPGLLASGELSIESSMDVAYKTLDPALVAAVRDMHVGTLVYYGFAPVPAEVSSYPGAPGLFVDPEIFLSLGNFDFFEGDVESALWRMRQGQAVLLTPLVAERLGVGLGDVVPVETLRGIVEFGVAGIGGTSTSFSVFSYADGEAYFGLSGPSWLGIVMSGQTSGRDVETMLSRARTAIAAFEDVVVFDMRDSGVGGLVQIVDRLQVLLNALLTVAVVVAGLGVVNTVTINVTERRREIALLRAVGATQRQVRQAVVAEAATLGVMAALLSIVLGLTMLVLFAFVFVPNGASSVGLRITWENAGRSLGPALRDLAIAGVLSLLFGPLVAALAAYLPAKRVAEMRVVDAARGERATL